MSVTIKTRHTSASEPYRISTDEVRPIQVELVTDHVYTDASHFGLDAAGAIFIIKKPSELITADATGATPAAPQGEVAIAVYGPGQWMSAEVTE